MNKQEQRDIAISRLVGAGYSKARVARGFGLSRGRVSGIVWEQHFRRVRQVRRMAEREPVIFALGVLRTGLQPLAAWESATWAKECSDSLTRALDAEWDRLDSNGA